MSKTFASKLWHNNLLAKTLHYLHIVQNFECNIDSYPIKVSGFGKHILHTRDKDKSHARTLAFRRLDKRKECMTNIITDLTLFPETISLDD